MKNLKDTGIKIGNSYKDTRGDQVLSGFSFTPSVVIFVAVDIISTNLNFSVGFDDGANHKCIYLANNVTNIYVNPVYSLDIKRSVGNEIKGIVSAVAPGSVTITWTLGGTSSADFIFLFLP